GGSSTLREIAEKWHVSEGGRTGPLLSGGVQLKRLVTWLALVLTALFALAGAGVGYLYVAFPGVEPPEEGKVASTPELLERGKYLVEHVALCTDCHSERDLGRFSGPVKPGTEG